MTPREWRILEIALLVVILTGLGIYAWSEIRRSHDLIDQAEAKSAAERSQRLITQAQMEKIVSDQKEQIDQLRIEFAKIKTPQQAMSALPTYFPTVGQPTVIQVPGQPATATSPAQPAFTQYVMTAEQLMALAKAGEICKECEVNLLAANGTTDLLRNELAGCTEEVKTWKFAAKGGSLWHRLTHDIALAGTAGIIGALVGGAIVAVIKPFRSHRKAQPAREGTEAEWKHIRGLSTSSRFLYR